MDMDDLPLRKDSPLASLEKEDLSTISVDELGTRIDRLQAEINRTQGEMDAKGTSRSAAEALFAQKP